MTAVACFVTPHGYGHAARTSAVLEALADHVPGLRPELFTTVPEWFFADSLREPFGVHPVRCDVGVVQRGPLHEDLDATADELDRFLPFDEGLLERLAGDVRALGCRAVLADVAPLGLAVARRAGLPAVLLESFTWDWIYEGYAAACPRLAAHAAALAPVFLTADLRLQAAPACAPARGAVTVPPVARAVRRGREATRAALGAGGEPVVLVSMGGVPWRPTTLDALAARAGVLVVVPGAADRPRRRGSLLALPHRSAFHHPDLVAAADLVVGKLGYSTVAEAWCAGARMLYVPRDRFRESPVLARFVEAELPARAITEADLESGAWLDHVAPVLGLSRPVPRASGAGAAAEALASLLARAPGA